MRSADEILAERNLWWVSTSNMSTLTSIIEQAQREAIEEAAAMADTLGGDRERRPLREGNDVEARSQQTARAQHVRAKTIATAIRNLLPTPSAPTPSLDNAGEPRS